MEIHNILINTQNFPPEAGGIQYYMYELARALHNIGHHVSVVCDAPAVAGQQEFDGNLPFAIKRISGPKLIRRYRKAKWITKYLNSHQTLLISDSWKSLELLNPAKFRNLCSVCIAHGMEFPSKTSEKKKNRITKTLALADFVLANSQFTAQRLRPYTSDTSHTHILHPGVTPPPTPNADETTNISNLCMAHSPILLTVGRLEARKGQDKIIEILPKLLKDHPNLLYVLAGTGPLQENLLTRTNELGIADKVKFCGRVSDGERSALLQKADLFAMPCRAVGDSVEGFGIVYIEAAMQGVASLAGRVGGASDAVLDGRTGMLCDGDDENDIYLSIKKMLADSAALKSMGQQAQHRAQTELQWEQIAQKLLTLCTANN